MVSAALSSRPSSVQRTCYAKENDTHHTESKARQSAMREQIRREQQRRRMVKWRKQKKEKKINMVDERRRLEKELQRHVLQARIALNNVTIRSAAEAYRHVTVERAALMSENVALREAIEKKVKAQAQVEREVQEFLGQLHTEESLDLVQRDGDGWRVQLANGAPCFYFSPFTREEFDNVFKDNDVTYAERHPCTATVGKILGWTVDYAPLVRNEARTFFVAHARFTRRLRCPLDKAHRILPHLDKNIWPVLVTPRSWGISQIGINYLRASTRMLWLWLVTYRVTFIYGTLLPHDTHENGDRMVNVWTSTS
ncbi:cleavage induced hypothetical protein [Phytophthora infestans T30-4]|uniref:Uncharacterized protein n=1 Tax=Phytophthora infestans (strain T30-4) TaxID=403677 RepID=D0NIY0_PHYIT|nr:cleavage induced hypothetical protein [Phytophthora infestans T30-4]EEY59464.1 cleavage induced hypothetical protein [Phytophthora infestans T30-4]|eukprot:XP_002901074.1 cleavage induced hypothetical protein [Phytophthora infestans T30-4]